MPVLPLNVQPAVCPAGQPAQARQDDLLREAEAQRALAELFPHLKLNALRAIKALFPQQAARTAALYGGCTASAEAAEAAQAAEAAEAVQAAR